MRPSHRSLLALFALVLIGSGCSNTETSTPSPTGGGSQTPGTDKPKVPNTGTPDETPGAPSTPATCEGATGEFYGFSLKTLAITDNFLTCSLKGSAVLIVNGASDCGFTPQYEDLQTLYETYKDQKFAVIAFPSNSFDQDAKGTAYTAECADKYGVRFPLMATDYVIDDPQKNRAAQPFYKWLYAQPGMSAPVEWNFHKFLISREGKVVKRWAGGVSPSLGSEVDIAVKAELAK